MAVSEPLWRPPPRVALNHVALNHAQYRHLSTHAYPSSSVPVYSRGRRVARRFGRGRGGAFA